MALKSLSFLMISALLMATSSLFGVSTAFGGRKALAPDADAPGADVAALPPDADFDFDFVPLNTKDPKVIDLAKFAIDEYNKENDAKLVFSAVFEALYTNSEKGTDYGLVVAATKNKELNDYNVNILVAKDAKKVTSFKQND